MIEVTISLLVAAVLVCGLIILYISVRILHAEDEIRALRVGIKMAEAKRAGLEAVRDAENKTPDERKSIILKLVDRIRG